MAREGRIRVQAQAHDGVRPGGGPPYQALLAGDCGGRPITMDWPMWNTTPGPPPSSSALNDWTLAASTVQITAATTGAVTVESGSLSRIASVEFAGRLLLLDSTDPLAGARLRQPGSIVLGFSQHQPLPPCPDGVCATRVG